MELFKLIGPLILAFIMFSLGIGLSLENFKRVIVQPKDFIISIVLARMFIVLTQLSVILALAIGLLKINIMGGLPSLLGAIVLGAFIFYVLDFSLVVLLKHKKQFNLLHFFLHSRN